MQGCQNIHRRGDWSSPSFARYSKLVFLKYYTETPEVGGQGGHVTPMFWDISHPYWAQGGHIMPAILLLPPPHVFRQCGVSATSSLHQSFRNPSCHAMGYKLCWFFFQIINLSPKFCFSNVKSNKIICISKKLLSQCKNKLLRYRST